MSKSAVIDGAELASNDNSISTKEFLNIEKSCETYKDSDEEIKMIFTEINKLSGGSGNSKVIDEDVDDVELILKRAEDIALETENLLKSCPVATVVGNIIPGSVTSSVVIPQIKVSKPNDNHIQEQNVNFGHKVRKKILKQVIMIIHF